MAYLIEYARTGRSGCKGPKPCAGTKIDKGSLRVGVVVEIQGHTTFAWRHWGCVTPKVAQNMKDSLGEAEELDGYEELNKQDQARVRDAFQEGHIASNDVTPALKEAYDNVEAKSPEKKRARKLKKDDDEEGSPKQKPKKRKTKQEITEEHSSEEESIPAKRRTTKTERIEELDTHNGQRAKRRSHKKTGDVPEEAQTPAKRTRKAKKNES